VSEQGYTPTWPSKNSLVSAAWKILDLDFKRSLWILNVLVGPGDSKATVTDVKIYNSLLAGKFANMRNILETGCFSSSLDISSAA
jgi:hypothetical protein